MITPAWRIRDAVEADMDIVRMLFTEEDMGDVRSPENIRIAARVDNTILGALRCEKLSDGNWYIRPVVVFEVVRGQGIGEALVKDALKLHPDLMLIGQGYVAGFYEKCGFQRIEHSDLAPEQLSECKACPDMEACQPVAFRAKPVEYTFTFMGTTSGCGVPAFFCHCKACEAARKDPSLRRGCTGGMIQGHQTILIDTPPDTRYQLIREGVDDIDQVFLTHAHFDHLGGMGELEYLVRLYRDAPLPFHASPYAMKETMAEFSYMEDCYVLDEMGEYETRTADGLTIQALPLNHCPGCYGYLITTPAGKRTFYAPDSAELKPEVFEILKGVDNLILDATFWENDSPRKTHHSVKETIDDGMKLEAGRIYLTHIAPHICHEDENIIDIVEEHIKQYKGRVVLAHDGLKVRL